jgi:hypothetical protein
MIFAGPNINSISAQVDSRPLAVLNFHLPSLAFQSPAAITVHAALTPFFLPTEIFDLFVNLEPTIVPTKASADLDIVIDSDSDQDYQMLVDPPATSSSAKVNLKQANMTNSPIIPDVDPLLYMYRDIPFNFATSGGMKQHQAVLDQLVSELKQSVSIILCNIFINLFSSSSFSPVRILLFVSTHSDPDSGDPWVSEPPECLTIADVCSSFSVIVTVIHT